MGNFKIRSSLCIYFCAHRHDWRCYNKQPQTGKSTTPVMSFDGTIVVKDRKILPSPLTLVTFCKNKVLSIF